MSIAIQRSKYTGDPGWLGDVFGAVGKVAKSALRVGSQFMPGPIGAVYRGVESRLFPPAPGTTTYAQMPYIAPIPSRPTAGPGGAGAMDCAGNWSDIAARYGMTVGRAQAACASQGPGISVGPTPPPMLGAPVDQAAAQAGKPCPVSGYHWNKSGYFLKSGEYVPAGTKMVRNRRRNPANPRATSNAIMRIKGAKRYAASLSSISIRKKC